MIKRGAVRMNLGPTDGTPAAGLLIGVIAARSSFFILLVCQRDSVVHYVRGASAGFARLPARHTAIGARPPGAW